MQNFLETFYNYSESLNEIIILSKLSTLGFDEVMKTFEFYTWMNENI
jgi:hypothetical protein